MTQHAWSESAAAYALNALEPAERSQFETHLAECEQCRRDVDAYQHVAAELAAGAPQTTPPSALRDRVFGQLQDADGYVDGVSAAPSPQALNRASASPARSRLLWGALAASLVLSATVGWMLSRSSAARSDLERAYEGSQAAITARDDTIARQQELLDTLLAPNVSTASLVSATPTAPRLQLFWNRDTDLLVVAAFNLPPASPGRAYQLWGIQGDGPPVSLGLFDAGTTDSAVSVTAPSTVPFDLAAVTEEPAGGSPQPTSDPFLVGAWNHAD